MHTNEKKQQHNVYHHTAIYQNTQLYAICSRVYFIYQVSQMFLEFYVNDTFFESSSSSSKLPYHIPWLPVAMPSLHSNAINVLPLLAIKDAFYVI